MAKPAGGEESESEGSESPLPLQNGDLREVAEAEDDNEEAEDSDVEPFNQGEMDQAPAPEDEGATESESEIAEPASPEIREIEPSERSYKGRDELFESPAAGNSGPRQNVIIEMCIGLMQHMAKHEPKIMKRLGFPIQFDHLVGSQSFHVPSPHLWTE